MGQFIKKFQDMPESTENNQVETEMDPYHEMFQKCVAEISKFYSPAQYYFIRGRSVYNINPKPKTRHLAREFLKMKHEVVSNPL